MTAAAPPTSVPTAAPGEDTAALGEEAARCGRELAGLPPPSRRDPDQTARAARARERLRALRARFLEHRAEQVYGEATHGLVERPRIRELVHAAALRFPGLLPDEAALRDEQARPAADKEGLDVDVALFLRAVLRCPPAGRHLLGTMLTATGRARALADRFRVEDRVDLGTVLVERSGDAGVLTVNNQHCLNAEDNRLIADMETAVDLVALHPGVRVGVLRGGVMTHPKYAGRRVFSAGLNLRDLHDGRISFLDFLVGREMGYVSKFLHGVRDDAAAPATDGVIALPWVAVVEGFAIGGGAQILTVMDRVVAEEDAFVSLPAAQEGIVPGLAALRLHRLVGGREVRRLVLAGARIRAGAPAAAALVDDAVPPERLEEAVRSAVTELAHPAVPANRRMIALAEEPPDVLREYLAEFVVVQARRLHEADVADAARAFAGAPGAVTP